jgi:subtilisin-like proprotein convertase family protein
VVDTADAGRSDTVGLVVDVSDNFAAVEERRNTTVTAIPDSGTTTSVLDLSASPLIIADLTVVVSIAHPRRSDLQVTLVPPAPASPVVLASAPAATRPGLFRSFGTAELPELRALKGQSAQGSWRLQVQDTVAGQTGVLYDWRLIIATR